MFNEEFVHPDKNSAAGIKIAIDTSLNSLKLFPHLQAQDHSQ